MRVGIVGAGCAGLVSLKACNEEGFDVVCYEKSNEIAGLWSPRPPVYGQSHGYNHLVTNTSRDMITLSDHPYPTDCPTFLTKNMVYEYLSSYTEKFELMQHVKLEHIVHKLQKTEDHETTGCWEMIVEDLNSDEGRKVERFDRIMLCTGLYSYPFIPKLPNADNYNGLISHSHYYTCAENYKAGEKTLVVGNRSSGLDIATDLAKRGSQPVYLSCRSGVLVLTRDYDSPYDLNLSLFAATIAIWAPRLFTRLVFRKIGPTLDRFKKFRNWPEPTPASLGALSDEIYGCLEQGTVKCVANIKEFTENGVILIDGTELEVDRVVMATGYELTFPFLSKDILDPANWCLYNKIWPVHLHKNTFAAIGMVRTPGSSMPLFELQARWAVQIFKGEETLPSPQQMKADTPVFASGDPHLLIQQLHVNHLPYEMKMAGCAGCYPGFRFLLRHPLIWLIIYFGAAYPPIFRLTGPGKSADAWHMIEASISRATQAMNAEDRKKKLLKLFLFGLLGFALFTSYGDWILESLTSA
ncbi:flavin-containing monooxygenase 3-like [Watersipora subatra]|uniref:flavin-containing monooxygenase 3-like n=1 Tax=Watersipora subatra TaxID=2589382 RepID=UPI00355B39A7